MSAFESAVNDRSVVGSEDVPTSEYPRPPRREFKARGSFVTRCEGCNLPVLNCLCPYKVKAESVAQVWLLTHPLEHFKPTNTGRLIGDVITTTQVFTWYRTAPDAQLAALLKDPPLRALCDFSGRSARLCRPCGGDRNCSCGESQARIPVFVILDGTWRQARRMFRKSPYLDDLPVLPLQTERETRYRLRKPASKAHLCTAEVAIELLRQGGDTAAADVLDDYFDVFNDSYAASRLHHKIDPPTAAMRRLAAKQSASNSESGHPGAHRGA